jgi:tetratricopeptide (TPR) repeat protein
MKRLFVTIAAFGLAAAVAFAQDFNAAIDVFNAGATALEGGNKVEALTQFRSALTQFQACEGDEAAEMIAKCKEIIPGTLLSIAKEQINEADYDKALASLAEAESVAKEFGQDNTATEAAGLVPNVYLRKGSTLLKDKDFAGAAAAFKEVVAITPEDGQAQLLLGQALMQNNDLAGATEALEKAASLGKEDQAHKLLGTAYLKEGQALLKANKTADAVAALEKSNSYSESANAYKLIASAQTKAGKNKEAIAAYKKYLEVSPNAKDAADIMFTIAATAQKAGDKATAKEYYNKLTGDAKYGAQAQAQLKAL